jgi:hypothetical protein
MFYLKADTLIEEKYKLLALFDKATDLYQLD